MRLALRLSLFALALAIYSMPRAAVAADPQPPAKPPELKVLDRLIGDFEYSNWAKVLSAEPVDVKYNGTISRKWILNGWVVEEFGKNDKEEVRVFFSYDVYKSQYRMYYFSSAGVLVDAEGKWDEAKKTMSWHKDLGNNMVQSGTSRFIDDNTQEWESSVKDAAGKVYFHGGGKVTRKR